MTQADTPTPKARRGRPPGRPPTQADAADQRARLIAIALDMYSRHGFAGTTLAGIARDAGMTPAAVHYYFKTREQLFDEIHEAHIAPMRERVEAIFQEHPHEPVAAFTKVAERFIDMAEQHPWIGPVFFGDLITDNDSFRKHMRKRVDNRKQAGMMEAIERWQANGLMNPDLDPRLVFVSILSLAMLPMTARRKWAEDPIRKGIDRETIRRHAVALLTHGLGPATA